MKKSMIMIALIALSFEGFSQQTQDNPRNNWATVSVQTNVHAPVVNRITGQTEPLNQGQTSFYLVLVDPIPQAFYMEKAGCFTRTGEPYYFLKNSVSHYLRCDNGSFVFDPQPNGNMNRYYWVFREAVLQDEQGRPGRYIYNAGAGIDSSLQVNGRNLIVMHHHDDDDNYQVFYIH